MIYVFLVVVYLIHELAFCISFLGEGFNYFNMLQEFLMEKTHEY